MLLVITGFSFSCIHFKQYRYALSHREGKLVGRQNISLLADRYSSLPLHFGQTNKTCNRLCINESFYCICNVTAPDTRYYALVARDKQRVARFKNGHLATRPSSLATGF